MAESRRQCFHCGLHTSFGPARRFEVLGEAREFCCDGCLAVARSIVESGLEDYYRYREAPAARADPEVVPDILRKLALYDNEDVQRSFVRQGAGWREASLILEDIRCPACLWLNEQHIRGLDGVLGVEMDYTSQRAHVRWDPGVTRLSVILKAISNLGFLAYPYDTAHREKLLRDRKRRSAQRLIFAGAIAMPVMQFSLASYWMGGPQADGTLPLWEVLGRWTMLAAVTAVLAWSGQEFFVGAWRDLRIRRLGMDVPIVLGLSIAWLGSLIATVQRHGEVYLDSIAMFVLFILAARVLEMRGRVHAADAMDRLARVVPQSARRIGPSGAETEIPAAELNPGDLIRVRPGEFLPADGVVAEGAGEFDESVLTGESAPVVRQAGEPVIAGSCNTDQAVLVEVRRVGEDSTAGEIRHLLDRGLSSKPPAARLADRVAGWFVAAVLVVAVTTAIVWWWLDPERMLSATIAVLIVTCPCALALATPVAIAVSAGRYASQGVLPLDSAAMETLATVDVVALDKTGTLTLGQLRVCDCYAPGPEGAGPMMDRAGALERHSEHPVARAFRREMPNPTHKADRVRNQPGRGVCGVLGGHRWRLGSPEWVAGDDNPAPGFENTIRRWREAGCMVVALGDPGGLRAVFALRDRLRPGAEVIARQLRDAGVSRIVILSGDSPLSVTRIARKLGIDEALGSLTPSAKMTWIQDRQHEGHRVLMVGDGINDVPTLAAADVSISFSNATELAQINSRFVLLSSGMDAIVRSRELARRTIRIIRQNLAWAAGYNLLAVPAAAMGFVPPWAAAIGMSLSSLLVVVNALRLRRVSVEPSTGAWSGDTPRGAEYGSTT